MNPEIKDEWTNRLLDDDTIQAVGLLHIHIDGKDGFCCWGILADILESRGLIERRWSEEENGWIAVYHKKGEPDNFCSALPAQWLLDAAGIPWDAGDTGHIVSHLSGLNDNGSNFPYIASEIMENKDL